MLEAHARGLWRNVNHWQSWESMTSVGSLGTGFRADLSPLCAASGPCAPTWDLLALTGKQRPLTTTQVRSRGFPNSAKGSQVRAPGFQASANCTYVPKSAQEYAGGAGSSWVRSQGLTGVLSIPSKNPTVCLGNDIHEHSGSYDLPSEQYTRTLAKKTSTSLQRHLCLLFRKCNLHTFAALRSTDRNVVAQLNLQLLENLPKTCEFAP